MHRSKVPCEFCALKFLPSGIVQGLGALQPRFLRWLGQLGGAADCLLMTHPLLQAGNTAATRRTGAPGSGFENGTWRGMEDKVGLQAHVGGSDTDVTIWLDGLLPQVSAHWQIHVQAVLLCIMLCRISTVTTKARMEIR